MPAFFTLAVIAYVCATGLALAYLIQREELVYRIASVVTLAAWALHTLDLVKGWLETGRPPLGSVAEAVSVAVWVAVGLTMWVEREYGLKVLGAFVLPVVLMLSVSIARPLGLGPMNRALSSAWLWVHIALALVGIAAFVLNFAGALMYLLQERQLKSKRAGRVYRRLPPLETLDRLTVATLTAGFPFLTVGLLLGVLSARHAWGSVVTFDPLALFSVVMWVIYAAILVGRVMGHWRGRRAAYFSIAGFCVLLVTLSAGAFLHGRHGS